LENEAASKKIPLSLLSSHREFISWIASNVGGIDNHYKLRSIKMLRLIPDVCIVKDGNLVEAHEVEVCQLSRKKIKAYSTPYRPKTVLWVCIPPLYDAYDEVNVVFQHIKPKTHIQTIPLEPSKSTKGKRSILISIRCKDCGCTFNSLKDWENHLLNCEGV